MYLIFSKNKGHNKYLKILKDILDKNGILTEEYLIGSDVYLVTYSDPSQMLPKEFKNKVDVSRLSTHDYKKLVKNFYQLEMKPTSFKENQKVKVIEGPFANFVGVVKKKLNNGKYEVIVSVFGHPAIIEVEEDKISSISYNE